MKGESHSSFVSLLIPAIKAAILFVIVCGIIYSVVTTAVANTIFLHQIQGGRTKFNGKVINSKVISDNFTTPKYFYAHPIATNR